MSKTDLEKDFAFARGSQAVNDKPQPQPLTDEEIEAFTRIEKAATPAPWSYSLRRRVFENPDSSLRVFAADGEIPNIVLALTARNALPRLLAERAEDKAKIKELEGWLDIIGKPFDLDVLTAELRKAAEASAVQ